ncbi:hypothetical protein Pst134EA_011346 [Puccinia striiformis f. sp. tritici]|uniref:hypothetical protein n=1 Tax=Puccinia striiformis f. sp. tritici TaxID=168172 RepID=UPI0020084940|nr:hypothetical protein Pst134EA_011346 [Puccinia striiformis f. sp. tritici]KAH9456112.1 hypothetical protein Pst134EB_012320 [Puccinia striiformis f. sp. tritici]KAH9467714.1 hypothetical protein Pst134EA_011346 [Puccinia striiformis f. sp. tritici]
MAYSTLIEHVYGDQVNLTEIICSNVASKIQQDFTTQRHLVETTDSSAVISSTPSPSTCDITSSTVGLSTAMSSDMVNGASKKGSELFLLSLIHNPLSLSQFSCSPSVDI